MVESRRNPVSRFIPMPGTQVPLSAKAIASIPKLEDPSHTRLQIIGGRPPDLINPPAGCRFSPNEVIESRYSPPQRPSKWRR